MEGASVDEGFNSRLLGCIANTTDQTTVLRELPKSGNVGLPETISLQEKTSADKTYQYDDEIADVDVDGSCSQWKTGMTYDTLLTSLGEYGWRQKMICVLAMCIPDGNLAIQLVSSVFTMAVVSHRCAMPWLVNDIWEIQGQGKSLAGCAIPWLANDTWKLQGDSHAMMVNLTIPPGDLQPYSSCSVYTAAWAHNATLLTSADWDKRELQPLEKTTEGPVQRTQTSVDNSTRLCDRYVYDTSSYKSSISIDLNLVCGRSLYRSHAQMTTMLGCLVGSQLCGLIADVWGRKLSMMIFMMLNIVSMFSLAFVHHYVLLLVISFLIGMSAMGTICPGFIISMETTGPFKRMWVAVVPAIFFSMSLLLMSLLAYFLRNRVHLQLVYTMFTLPYLAYWWLVPESPCWLLAKGRVQEAEVILTQFARANQTTLDPTVLEKLHLDASTAKVSLWRGLFRARTLLGRYLIVFFSWFVASFSFYGVNFNIGSLGGNVYLNVVLGALLDVVAILLSIPLMKRVGRRPLSSALFFATGVACVATLFPVIYASKDHQWITVVLALVGKCAMAVNFSFIWVYSSELFPTVMRNSCHGAASVCARVGGILAPYVANMSLGGAAGKAIPLVILGVPAIVVSLLTLCLPETLHQSLPDTVQDAVHMHRKQTKHSSAKE